MRRALLMSIVGVLCAVPAQAQGWRWLEKLSGPGDFTGYEVNVKLWCGYDPADMAIAAKKRMFSGVSLPCVFKKTTESGNSNSKVRTIEGKDGKDGRDIDLRRRQWALGIGTSYLRGSNDLPYAPTDEYIDRTIQIVAVEGFFDHRISSRTDWGFAFGPNLFLVPAADNLVRWSVEPRVTVKLFDLQRGPANTYLGTASLRVGLLAFFGGFTASDFAAIGPYHAKSEVGPSVRFILDFDRNPFTSK
jgi:hypothetical protein